MRRVGNWLRAKPARLHVLLAAVVSANAVALFLVSWTVSLALQALSLLAALALLWARGGAS